MFAKAKTVLLGAAAALLLSLVPAVAAEWSPPGELSGDVVIGSPTAPVTVYEYASMTCPHCARFHAEVLPEFRRSWIDTGKARLVFRHFPLDKSALAASLAVSCLPADDRPMAVTKLFATVEDWSVREDISQAMIDTVRPKGDPAAFVTCMSSKETAESVARAAIEAGRGGVAGTPTFFVNGSKMLGIAKAEVLGGHVDLAIKSDLTR